MESKNPQKISDLPVSFITVLMSFASSAVMALGLEKNPHTDKYEKDLPVARFNIDMLKLMKEKTKNNLTLEEQQFLDMAINDLQMKFVYASQNT
ncbi:MAG: DUF1844 domain-containing protein [Bdellovibrionales bacterium]